MSIVWHNPTTDGELVQVKLDELAVTGRRPVVLMYGGGLDSFDMLLRASERGELPDFAVFANVGDPADHNIPGEWPGTLQHIVEVAAPLCRELGVAFVALDHTNGYPVRRGKKDEAKSLFHWFVDHHAIPVSNKRQKLCTQQAKVERCDDWLGDNFTDAVEVWLGFNASEAYRVDAESRIFRSRTVTKHHRYPLIEQGVCRCSSVAHVAELGLPVPRKSACVFCPFGPKPDWKVFHDELPIQFGLVAWLEERKPPTQKNGIKLSIKGYGKRADGSIRAPMIRDWVNNEYGSSWKPLPCKHCGSLEADRSDRVGCDYYREGELVQIGSAA